MSYADDARATFTDMLQVLDSIAAKAQDAGLGDDILSARLVEDMFSLEQQFRVALNQVLLALNQVTAGGIPLEETPYATLAEVRERIAGVRRLVHDAPASDWKEGDAQIDFTLPNDMRFVMSAAEYLRDWTMPNFYFHVAMAYALLRQAGLPIGKLDFLQHMMRHAAPAAA